jgi:hypothetical protein
MEKHSSAAAKLRFCVALGSIRALLDGDVMDMCRL